MSDGQLRSIIDRILRLKEGQDEIGNDVKEIYAEAKSNGYDKTAIGKVVAHLRARGKDASKFDEQEAIFALYLSDYTGTPSHAHAHEGKADAAPALGQQHGTNNVGVVGAEDPLVSFVNLPGSPLAASVDRAVA